MKQCTVSISGLSVSLNRLPKYIPDNKSIVHRVWRKKKNHVVLSCCYSMCTEGMFYTTAVVVSENEGLTVTWNWTNNKKKKMGINFILALDTCSIFLCPFWSNYFLATTNWLQKSNAFDDIFYTHSQPIAYIFRNKNAQTFRNKNQ